MNTDQLANTGIELWLKQATNGLTPTIKAIIQGEINNHFMTAVQHHLDTGMQAEEASRVALEELGNAREMGRVLRRTYLTRNQCVAASFVSFLFPLVFIPLLLLGGNWLSENSTLILIDAAILLPTLYVFFSLTKLNQYRFKLLNGPMVIIAISVIFSAGSRILHVFLFGQTVYENGGGAHLFSGNTGSIVLILIALASELMGGIGMLLFGLRLQKLPGNLYGLRNILVFLFVLMSLASFGLCLGVGLNQILFASLTSVVGYIALIATFGSLSLVFYRSAVRVPSSIS